MKTVFYIFALMIALMPLQIEAADPIKTSKADVVFDDSSPHIEMENGRTYYLVNSTVIEKLRLVNVPVKYNVFDFDNGVLIQSFDVLEGCQNLSTPFTSLPAGRADEVKAIGCKIYDNEKRLVQRNDEMDYYNKKFCQPINVGVKGK